MSDERRERAMRIIKGLLEKKVERGATPAEAASAVAKVQELLERYQLTMLDVEKQEIKENMNTNSFDTKKKNVNHGELALANVVAYGYDCKLVVERDINTIKYVFLGYQSDVEIAEYTFVYLLRLLKEISEREAKQYGVYKQKFIRWNINFLTGAASTIGQRLKERKTVVNQKQDVAPNVNVSEQQPKSTGCSLMLIKQPKVAEYVKTKYPRLSQMAGTKAKRNVNALDAGRRAGQNVPLNKGIKQENVGLLS